MSRVAEKDVRAAVQEKYGAIARGERGGCCGDVAKNTPAIGYTAEDLAIAGEANLGLGCGNPLALAEIRPGMTVVDLGSGAGFDAFLAWRRVGPTGRVIGVDMTDDMLALARENAARLGATNVEFRKGSIEKLPVEDGSVDLVISNCVVNLSPDKPAVFRELARVLKAGGQFALSDIVLLKPLPKEVAADLEAYVGCVAGASLLSDYLAMALAAGLGELSVPQITPGKQLTEALAPSASNALKDLRQGCGCETFDAAVAGIVSAKIHGRKAAPSGTAACCA
ncbi:MAG TPA: arsenite methyltransferase [Terriglobales bacterium]|nr:arsenite methyltransferase [Terriglobales bacterium]